MIPAPAPTGLDRIFSNPLAMYAVGLTAGAWLGWSIARAARHRCTCEELAPERVAELVGIVRAELARDDAHQFDPDTEEPR
jgi:hypothetical protein